MHVKLLPALLLACAFPIACPAADLTGNWLAATPNGDGTMRRTWLNLKQHDGRISGTIRSGQSFYTIAESSGGPDHFTLTGVVTDEGRERRAIFEVTLANGELNVAPVRNNTPAAPIAAHRVPDGDGALARPRHPPRAAQGSR